MDSRCFISFKIPPTCKLVDLGFSKEWKISSIVCSNILLVRKTPILNNIM